MYRRKTIISVRWTHISMYDTFSLSLSLSLYTMVRGQMKGAAWDHIRHTHPAAVTAGSMLLSEGCIFHVVIAA